MKEQVYGYGKDHLDAGENAEEKKSIGKERVDVFGEYGEKEAPDGGKPGRLPVKYEDGTAESTAPPTKNRSSLITLVLTVLLLTTSFTALACTVVTGMGGDPREAAGGFAGKLLFGSTPEITAYTPEEMTGEATRATDDGTASGDEAVTTVPVEHGETPAESTDEGNEQTAVTTDVGFQMDHTGLINKTGFDLSLDALVERWGTAVSSGLKKGGVLVVCTHPLECFSDGTSIKDAAAALCQALEAAGVYTAQCTGDFDTPGRLGSYARAREAISGMLNSGSFALVIDIHTGDSPGLLVGAAGGGEEDAGWQMNAALAAMVNDELDTYSGSVTVDDGRYNQDLRVLSLHAELDRSLSASRGLRSARILADAVIKLMK